MKPDASSKKAAALELAGILALALLGACLLHASWQKWADPIIDSGPRMYATWRVSLGATPYNDIGWNYGPLSLLFNAGLFKVFGPGLMVVAWANILIYVGIAAFAYLAFRKAWGRLAAFAALAVFVSVFSFSMINSVGNYNYVLPYANETTHGMLVILLTAFVMVRWCEHPSLLDAFLLGLGGGVAAVLKPEFMLATGALGAAALVVRFRQGQRPRWTEWAALLVGAMLPTLLVAFWFACRETWPDAIIDACQAWGRIFVTPTGPHLADQFGYAGFDYGWRNIGWEALTSMGVAVILGILWAAGWMATRPWKPVVRCVAVVGVLALACSVDTGGGFELGPCLPGLMVVVFVVYALRVSKEWKTADRARPQTLMALALILLAFAMLARMALRARINHFGFVQAALAGMVVVAVAVAEIPRLTGPGILGRRITLAGLLIALALACRAVLSESATNHALQMQAVADGKDLLYAFGPASDGGTGAVVNWCVERMKMVNPKDTLLVLPEGVMINYLSRHERPLAEFATDEPRYVEQLRKVHPDYVIVIWGDQRDGGIPNFGEEREPGHQISEWLLKTYKRADSFHAGQQWVYLFQRK